MWRRRDARLPGGARAAGAVLLVLGLLLASLPVSALPQPPAGPFLPRGPITITADAHFNATNGVVAGTGTPGDPYVISGWAFATGMTAIRIHNVSAHFVIRDNSIDAGTGVHITQTTSIGVVKNNQFIVRGTGVLVANADAHIVDNSFLGNPSLGANGVGVQLSVSNSVVESNAFLYLRFGVYAEKGSPSIVCNDIHDDVFLAGIYVKLTTNALIDCNIVTQCTLGIKVEATFNTTVSNNTVVACYIAIEIVLDKDVTVSNNTLQFTLHTQLLIDTTSGNVTGNIILQGRADAVVIVRSPILFANNTVHANLGVGVRFVGTTGNVRTNVVSSNSVGIVLEGGSAPVLTANVMSNNTIGIDIPYASRQAIVNMSANIVNGVNIDGTIDASQRVYFYKQANVTIHGQVRDSGFSAGFFGSLTAQGGVVLYEVNTVDINATVISHHTIGVGVVNSFNVNVNSSLLLSNLVGIKAEVAVGTGPVPNCVVAGKDINITIPVDPVATAGIDLKGCLGIFANATISVVDVGLKVDGNAGIFLANSTILNTKIGADIQASPNMANLTANAFLGNRVGVRLSGTVGVFHNNTVQGNAEIGVKLENSAQLAFEGNNVSYNGAGLIDMEVCAGALTCSTIHARHNTFVENRGDGVRVHGPSTWRGDAAIGNEGDGFELNGGATLDGVVAIGNEGDGARILGLFDVDEGNFSRNEQDGLELVGNGVVTDSVFLHNDAAGIRSRSTYVTAFRLNVSYNLDGIAVGDGTAGIGAPILPQATLPALTSFVWSAQTGGVTFDIHRSTLLGNERDAIRAGSGAVNATHNYWGRTEGPSINVVDQVGAFQNGITPGVRAVPWYVDPQMTTTGPVFLL